MRRMIESKFGSGSKVILAILMTLAFWPLAALAALFFEGAISIVLVYFALLWRLESRYGP
jgi:hypothetical protein